MQDLKARSIEIGFGTSSAVVATKNGKPIVRTFPSSFSKKSVGLEGFADNFGGRRKTITVEVDGVEYEVGEDVALNGKTAERNLNDDYVNSVQYKALMLGALYTIHDDEIDVLGVGLPASHWSRREQAQKLAEGTHTYPCGRSITVKKAVVFPQPVAGLLAYVNTLGQETFDREFKDKTVVAIDAGYLTFDYALAKGLSIDPERSGATEQGVSRILSDIQKGLSEAFGVNHIPVEIIDDALWRTKGELKVYGQRYPFPLCEGQTVDGVETDVHYDVSKQLRVAPELAVTKLRNDIGDAADVDLFVTLGGPIDHYLPAVRNQYPRHQIIKMDDSITAVAKGLYYGALQVSLRG